MAVNRDKPNRWNADIAKSIDMYNDWFMAYAPQAFRTTRVQTTIDVESALRLTDNLTNIRPEILRQEPAILPTLRMSTCPPIAVDRLIGLSGCPGNLVKSMESKKIIPPRMPLEQADYELAKIADTIEVMADPDIFVWLRRDEAPSEIEVHRAATIVADRLCGAVSNPIIRNAQEKRQLGVIKTWLEGRGYSQIPGGKAIHFRDMPSGTFTFRLNVPVKLQRGIREVNIPIDAVIMPKATSRRRLPILIEAKSAGDFTNTNKRRKEEAMKASQLRATYGSRIKFNLFLCGYFDSGYLGYEAAEGIDWAWEHRIDDIALWGI